MVKEDQYERELKNLISSIEPICKGYMEEVEAHWDTLCKPLKSLGRLEELVITLGGIRRSEYPRVERKQLLLWQEIMGLWKKEFHKRGKKSQGQLWKV